MDAPVMKVAVLGARAATLCRSVQAAPWNSCQFFYCETSLEELDVATIEAEAIIASADGGHQTQSSLVENAMSLRRCRFHWAPIHLLVPRYDSRLDLVDDWAIYLHPVPPPDARRLVSEVVNSS